jgi:hypothetical protein
MVLIFKVKTRVVQNPCRNYNLNRMPDSTTEKRDYSPAPGGGKVIFPG